jgi:gliding motility-associated lipoprotein GldB
MKRLIVACIIFLCFAACKKNTECIESPNVNSISANVNIIRLDQELKALSTKEEIELFLNKYPLFSETFLQRSQLPHDSVIINDLYHLVKDAYIDTLYQDAQTAFKDLTPIKQDLEQAFRYVKYYYPDFKEPVVYTMISGFSNDLFVSDSVIVIGLDYFMGDEGRYRPQVPNYILRRYKKEYIVPSIILMLSEKYNKTNLLDRSMMAEMVYYGKSYFFTKNMLPCTPDSLIIGFTQSEIEQTRANEERVWSHFVQSNLLFTTNHFEINRYIGERPAVVEIGEKAPGRIGRWVGWQIVKEYADRTDKTLPEVMKETETRKIFEQSKYRPS